MTRVLFVCLGNICRSPMAEGVFLALLEDRGLSGLYEVDSAGTSAFHAGEPPDPRTRAVLDAHGAPVRGWSRQVVDADFESFDHIFAMDRSNLSRLTEAAPRRHRRKLALVLGDREVPDPYYGGAKGFEVVHDLLHAALSEWLDARHDP